MNNNNEKKIHRETKRIKIRNKEMVNYINYVRYLKKPKSLYFENFKILKKYDFLGNIGYTCVFGSVINAIFHNDLFIENANIIKNYYLFKFLEIYKKKILFKKHLTIKDMMILENFAVIDLFLKFNNELVDCKNINQTLDVLKKYIYISSDKSLFSIENYKKYGYKYVDFSKFGYHFIDYLYNKNDIKLCIPNDLSILFSYFSYIFKINFIYNLDNFKLLDDEKEEILFLKYNQLNTFYNKKLFEKYYCKSIICFHRNVLIFQHCYNYTLIDDKIRLYSDYLKKTVDVEYPFSPFERHVYYIFNKKTDINDKKDDILLNFSIFYNTKLKKQLLYFSKINNIYSFEKFLKFLGFIYNENYTVNYVKIYSFLVEFIKKIKVKKIKKMTSFCKYFFNIDIYKNITEIKKIRNIDKSEININFVENFKNSLFYRSGKNFDIIGLENFSDDLFINNLHNKFSYMNFVNCGFYYKNQIKNDKIYNNFSINKITNNDNSEDSDVDNDENSKNIIPYCFNVNLKYNLINLDFNDFPFCNTKSFTKIINNDNFNKIDKIFIKNASIDHNILINFNKIIVMFKNNNKTYIYNKDYKNLNS